MSNNPIPPPLPYWGSNYTQPWASHPPSSGAVPHNMQYHPNPSAATPAPQNVESFYANANLPGFGGPGTNGSFPPPFAFPGAFPPAPGPPHFPTLPDMSYPLMPMPPTLSNVPPTGPPTNEFIHSAQSNTADSRPMGAAGSQLDLDREEGELTDIEGPNMAVEQHVPGSRKRHPRGDAFSSRKIHTTRDARNKRKQPAQAKPNASKELDLKNTHQSAITAARYRGSSSSDLEEGEASPGRPHSSRNSGSPYNPPMPIEPGSPFVSKSIRERPDPPSPGFETVDNSLPTSTISQISPDSGKPLVPLRVQAQGALLSLAPHNIRYHELVGEGIDPIILKQLYEEIGIKVPTTPLTELGTAVSSHDEDTPLAGPGAVDRQAKKSPQELEPQRNAVQSSTPVEPTAAPVQPVQANTAKPMERKEVIARMLAAKKAAKLSPASVPSQADRIPSPPSVPAAVEASTVPTPSQDPSSKDRESRVKEKNKAQTELARQRIEQLKKQGLIRSQQKLQPDSQLLAKEQGDSGLESSAANLTIVKHPLPERPPVPETASSDRIPGLFMTEQASEVPNDADTTLVQDFPLDAVSQPRTSQRKRPRASDFDDLVPISKRTYSNGTIYTPPERLIIDISDDETYDNDEDVAMQDEIASRDLIVSASDSLYPPPIDSLPHRPATSQSQAFSNSSTPNNLRNSEQEDLRKKNLEIQAMHRRIAELEQRKKARLASRTQSPRNSDVSPPEPVSLPFVSLPTPPNPSDNVDNIMTPLDAENLRKMKAKILRAQEIEAGVPSLDAEIQKSEAKLSDFKREEEMLLSELERGKEGRQQLLDELSTLKSELNGLSLDQVNTALIRLETKEELPVEVVQAPGYATEPSVQSAVATPEVSEADVHVQEDINSSQHADLTTQETPPAASLSNSAGISEDANVANGPEDEQSDTSMSEDSSSAMDESSDESGSSSASVHEEMPDAQHHSTEPVNPPDVNATTTQEIPHNLNAENQHEHSPTNSEDQSDIVAGFGEDLAAEAVNRPASRESSVSEAYEPPEPEESSSSSGSDSSYSPAPSPNPPGPATNMDVSGPLEDPPQEAGEPLTGKVQELDFQQPSQYSQIDILDNARCPEDTQHSFSPYVSPLRLFKSYRFHPSYNDEVSDSYRSLTYSHNIDPLKSLCPFESSGGVCNDRSCEFQHFRDMALSGASTPEQ